MRDNLTGSPGANRARNTMTEEERRQMGLHQKEEYNRKIEELRATGNYSEDQINEFQKTMILQQSIDTIKQRADEQKHNR